MGETEGQVEVDGGRRLHSAGLEGAERTSDGWEGWTRDGDGLEGAGRDGKEGRKDVLKREIAAPRTPRTAVTGKMQDACAGG
ncbi:hypothetical protein E2C01_026290 [Portunus trituberculatus]|uniref:Uncharacterized protein n=1 Tax=Portunus trituberculatus TaxID=210409 RepID=A0A5B7EHS8_PORTR|nr:hypothetical protein [Portunus trituberculatus]